MQEQDTTVFQITKLLFYFLQTFFIFTPMKKKVKQKPRHEQFKDAIAIRGIKQSFIAEKLGLSNSHLSNMLDGRYKIKDEYADAINDFLNTKI